MADNIRSEVSFCTDKRNNQVNVKEQIVSIKTAQTGKLGITQSK